MASNDLVLGQNHKMLSMPISQLAFDHSHDNDSTTNFFPEELLRCTQGNQGLAQNQTQKHEHDMDSQLQQPEHAQNLEQNGDQLDNAGDHVQDHAHSNNYDNILALSNDGFELNLSDDSQLALAQDDLDENIEFSFDQNVEMGNLSPLDMFVEQPMELAYNPSPLVLQSRPLDPSPNHQLTAGQQFPDAQSFRRALREAAIALRFEIQTVKSDRNRYTAQCASEGCPWRIHAAKVPGVPTFTIRTIRETHTCAGITHLGHHQASVQWVAESMNHHLRENPNIRPKEILEEIHRVHGITLSYKQAWRGKERIMAAVRGSFEEDYRLLPQYCDQIKRSNPGSIALVYGNPVDNCFQRLFISFQASIYGFLNACRPLIGLDCVPLKSKDLGTLLLAAGFDGDGGLYPLSFGVVNEEIDENWMWFISELHSLLETNAEHMPRLTILSNMKKGIVDGVNLNFPSAFHGFCMHCLSQSFMKEFNNTFLNSILWDAAYSLTPIEFEIKILEIEEISRQAAEWIRKVPPKFWATAYFVGTRLGQLTANIAESLDTMIVEALGLPIIQMMESIRRQLMIMFNQRRETGVGWTSILVPYAERQVCKAIEQAHSCKVLRKSDEADEFEVLCKGSETHIVNIRRRCCSCCGWQLCGMPCSHAVAVLLSFRQNVHRFTESCFTVANYRKAYSRTIHPIPDKAMWNMMSQGSENEGGGGFVEVVINPPKSLKPPGKPRKRRALAEDGGGRGGGRGKRVVHCSRCNQAGHFRNTCCVPI